MAIAVNWPGVLSFSENDSGIWAVSVEQGPLLPNQPTTAGVWGSSNGNPGVIGTSNAAEGVVGFSTNGFGVFGFSTNSAGIIGQTSNPAAFAGVFNGKVAVNGVFTAAVKNAMVPFPDGSQRVLHCMESPEHWFEDFGSAKLKRGRANVALDAGFAKVIKRRDYRVFLTPEGNCRGLYVHRRSAARFEVRELMGGESMVAFCYRIVGRRKDIKDHKRFAKADLLPLPAATTRGPRKPGRTVEGLDAYVAHMQREVHARKSKSKKRRTSRKRSRPDLIRLMKRLPSDRSKQKPRSARTRQPL